MDYNHLVLHRSIKKRQHVLGDFRLYFVKKKANET